MNQDPKDEFRIIPAQGVPAPSGENAELLEAQEIASNTDLMNATKRGLSKAGRYVVGIIVVIIVAAVVYAAVRLMTPSAPVTDADGCVWDEISVLQSAQYVGDAKKDYKVKTENGKTYLLRECKQ